MSFLRPAFARQSFRPLVSSIPRTRIQARFASGDYGSGKGDPAGEKPQQQGKNPSENIEHPGPPPPKVAQGKSSASPDETQQSSNKSSQSAGDTQTQSSSSGGRSGGGQTNKDVKKNTKGAQPKILNENPPGEHDESVRKHNEEMDQRAEKAHEQVSNKDAEKDKVPKKFWSGQGGVDRDP